MTKADAMRLPSSSFSFLHQAKKKNNVSIYQNRKNKGRRKYFED